MKKLLVMLAGCVTLFSQQASAQKSFYSGAFVLSTNFGVDGNTANRHYFGGPENNAQTLNGTAPASNFDIAGEYGLFDWLGLGLIGRVDNYFTEQNTLTQTSTSEGATDIGGTINIHLLRVTHLDLFAGYDGGFSHLIYHTNNLAGTTATSNGSWSDIHATGRIYAGRFGVNLTLFVPTFSYTSFQNSNMGAGDYIVNYWKSTGYGASVGLQYRF